MRKRSRPERGVGTRQTRLKVDSMLHMVSSSDTNRATTPVAVSSRALFAKFRTSSSTILAELGTKLENTKLVSMPLHSSNTGKADRMPKTTIDSGTSANKVV